jgi:hypothetical protein
MGDYCSPVWSSPEVAPKSFSQLDSQTYVLQERWSRGKRRGSTIYNGQGRSEGGFSKKIHKFCLNPSMLSGVCGIPLPGRGGGEGGGNLSSLGPQIDHWRSLQFTHSLSWPLIVLLFLHLYMYKAYFQLLCAIFGFSAIVCRMPHKMPRCSVRRFTITTHGRRKNATNCNMHQNKYHSWRKNVLNWQDEAKESQTDNYSYGLRSSDLGSKFRVRAITA